jgi:predicted nucleic-acid-binding protein
MKGIDTNVLIRYLTQDDRTQAAVAGQFLARCTSDDPGYVNRVVLCELVWVLDRGYGYTRSQIAGVLDKLLRTGSLEIEDRAIAWEALATYAQGPADYSDCIIAAGNRARGCESTATLDARAAKLAGMKLLS